MAVLEVEGLTVAFRTQGGWKPVVDDVSFAVSAGETLAIVGESGSGKSVTALAVMGLLPPRAARVSGSIRLGGRELLGLSEPEMERVRGNEAAMIFQEPMTSLNPVMKIGRQIGEAIMRHRRLDAVAAAAETRTLLERVRIPAAAARMQDYPHQLSGGTLQRVMIAMALACRPKLLIADEPTTALDVTVQAEILRLIRTLQEEDGMAVLFITHDMGVVAEIADRAAVMRRSRVVETATTAALFAAPREAYTRELLAAVPRLGEAAGTPLPAAAPESGEPAVSVRNLVARFNVKGGVFGRVRSRVHAVEDVSFDIRRGETLGLVGESGSGKSTVGRAILRLVQPVSGTIRVAGEDMQALAGKALTRHRRQVQMIFQDPISSLNPRLRVGEALAEPLLAHGLADRAGAMAKAEALLARVGLAPDMLRRFPHQLSGGQKQRVCIARALALEPAVIVADEAVSALDVSIKAQVIDLLLELQAGLGLGFLFISHDMAVVERVSHRVAVMLGGEIVEIGPRAAVFGDPRHPYTQRLLAAVPPPDPARRGRWRGGGEELRSPLRDLGYDPPRRSYTQVAPGHFVMSGDAP